VNPLLLPPRLVLRALDDLHTLAQAAGDLAHVARVGADMVAAAERMERRLESAADLGERIEQRGAEVVAAAAQIEDLLTLGGRIEERGAELVAAAARVDELISLGDRIEKQGRALVRRADKMDERAGELVDRLDKQALALLEQSKALYEQAAAILAQGERVEHAAREVAGRGAELVEALPLMQRALEMAEPLEGAVERLGRMVDRLPGARRAAST
jgi:hypothetical protein